jgi:hypothetical protein
MICGAKLSAKIYGAELGAMGHGAKPLATSVPSQWPCQLGGWDLGARAHGTETSYLRAMAHGSRPLWSKFRNTFSRGPNMNFFRKRAYADGCTQKYDGGAPRGLRRWMHSKVEGVFEALLQTECPLFSSRSLHHCIRSIWLALPS